MRTAGMQLAQDPEESWRECHLHARNLLGEAGYRQLLADIEADKASEKPRRYTEPKTPLPLAAEEPGQYRQGELFDRDDS